MLHSLKGSEYLVDSYLSCGNPKEDTILGSKYIMQYYQGNHKDDYSLKKDNKVCLFHNGVRKMHYQTDKDGDQIGDFTHFENGRTAFIQSFDDIFDKRDFCRIVNHVKGERMEIYSNTSGNRIHHGEFSEHREREGWGIEYDEESGSMLLEGVWKNNRLVEVIRKIEGNIMTEFKLNGNNTIVSYQIPLYVGELYMMNRKNCIFEMALDI